jgi:hypothetical protein
LTFFRYKPLQFLVNGRQGDSALRRSLLSASTLEVLQVLKQLYKGEHLQLVSHLLAKDDDYAIDHATEGTIHELISLRNTEELWDSFNSMDENRGSE